ncbi:PD-(D/E)XK nuclease family protein [Flavobacterium sp. I3-2]|uniref:PD-(D/E)XK nuclease family protein n=1 Tax=Flavobacterium sp. I3-2 TaxID=2748319 RepID=UPI0015AE4AAF|nr:PD-(D/E)XK nuclease family protein [Flavobacterium sp. I3-2]
MNENTDLLSDLLTQTEEVYKNTLIKKNLVLKKLIEDISYKKIKLHHIDYSKLNVIQTKSRLMGFENILIDFEKILEKENALSKEKSIRFNVLDFFRIDETLHSRLLGFFLDKNANHGQGDLFLKKFIENLGYNDYDEGKWNVTVEKQRIDILIERNHPHSVIIIENKSNDAIDQENQIYRYWHRTIYCKNKEECANNDKYKIIYLVANDAKLPSENTLFKPINFPDNLAAVVPLKIERWNFNNEIKCWLEDCLNLIGKENYRLKEYIKQYIEFWN